MTRKNQYTAQQFISAMPGSGGIVSTIARRVGCDWQTAKKYIDTMPSVQRAYQNECETVADMAESVLVKSIQEGDTGDAKWYLSRIRREKFATLEKQEFSGAEPLVIQVIYGRERGGNDSDTSA
jgi:hypothetical protein